MVGAMCKDNSFVGLVVGFLWKTYNKGTDSFISKKGCYLFWKSFRSPLPLFALISPLWQY